MPPLELTPRLLLVAYARGLFPMGEPETGEMHWYSPDPRAILPLDAFRPPRSLIKVIRRNPFTLRADTAFGEVIRACAQPRPTQPRTWINEEIIALYTALHEMGFAHSVEAWRDDRLVGGLYGVRLRGAFFGESMFSRPELGGTDSSKVCLAALVGHLRRRGATLLDTQFVTPHLARFGCTEIRRSDYLRRLSDTLRRRETTWGDFEAEAALRELASQET